MNIQDEISVELNALGARFGAAGKEINNFHVPDHYFQEFPDRLVSLIRLAEMDIDAPIYSKNIPFAVPPGYFESLSSTINEKIKAMDAIVEHSKYPWDAARTHPTYTIPDNYFEQFENQLFRKLKVSEIRVSDNLSEAGKEIESLSPLLASLKETQPYSVPQQYFEQLAKNEPVSTGATRVLEFQSLRSIKWARWVAAASILLIFSLGGWHFLKPDYGSVHAQTFEQALAKVPEAKIKEWLSNNLDEDDINSMDVNVVDIRSMRQYKTLNQFSEKEIKEYLEYETW